MQWIKLAQTKCRRVKLQPCGDPALNSQDDLLDSGMLQWSDVFRQSLHPQQSWWQTTTQLHVCDIKIDTFWIKTRPQQKKKEKKEPESNIPKQQEWVNYMETHGDAELSGGGQRKLISRVGLQLITI